MKTNPLIESAPLWAILPSELGVAATRYARAAADPEAAQVHAALANARQLA